MIYVIRSPEKVVFESMINHFKEIISAFKHCVTVLSSSVCPSSQNCLGRGKRCVETFCFEELSPIFKVWRLEDKEVGSEFTGSSFLLLNISIGVISMDQHEK